MAREGRRRPSAMVAIAVVFVILVFSLFLGQLSSRIVLVAPDGIPRFPSEIQSIAEPIVQNATIIIDGDKIAAVADG